MAASMFNQFGKSSFSHMLNHGEFSRYIPHHSPVIALPGQLVTTPCRSATHKSGGVSRNKRKRTIKKHRGFKVNEGEEVRIGAILCTQRQLRYYPGENVAIGNNMNLNAKENGRVMITVETLNPYPDSPIYPGVQKGDIIERIFMHVIPEKQHNRFILESLV